MSDNYKKVEAKDGECMLVRTIKDDVRDLFKQISDYALTNDVVSIFGPSDEDITWFVLTDGRGYALDEDVGDAVFVSNFDLIDNLPAAQVMMEEVVLYKIKLDRGEEE